MTRRAETMPGGTIARRWKGWVAGLALAGAAALGCTPPAAAPKAAAPEVEVALPVQEDVTDYEIFTGSVQAEKSVDLRAQVTGYLMREPLAQEGSDVKAGETLFKIDPSVFEAALAQAKANTNSANARAQSAQDIYARDVATPQATPEATRVQDLDALREAQAALKAAQAAELSAQLSVNFTDIKAPFDGRVSRRNVDPGNLVQQNLTSLATLVQLDPIYAYFDVDERTLLRIRKLVDQGVISPNSIKGRNLPVNLALSDEGTDFTCTAADAAKNPSVKEGAPRHPGFIKIVDNQENVQTGTLRMWGEFRNPVVATGSAGDNPAPRLLSPGMFARIQLPIGPPHPAVLVAEAALTSDQGRQLLYVVEDGKNDKGEPIKIAAARTVTIGAYHDGLREILTTAGDKPLPPNQTVKPGEQVILNGLQRVRDKGEVRVRDVMPMRGGDQAAGANGQGGQQGGGSR